jgi:hypothetical protein
MAKLKASRKRTSAAARVSSFGSEMNTFFTDLGHRYANAAASRGAVIPPPVLDPEVASQLLELAGVVAHTQERRFAPLACYLAGVAAERLRNARAGFPEAEVAAYVAEIRTGLESLSQPE